MGTDILHGGARKPSAMSGGTSPGSNRDHADSTWDPDPERAHLAPLAKGEHGGQFPLRVLHGEDDTSPTALQKGPCAGGTGWACRGLHTCLGERRAAQTGTPPGRCHPRAAGAAGCSVRRQGTRAARTPGKGSGRRYHHDPATTTHIHATCQSSCAPHDPPSPHLQCRHAHHLVGMVEEDGKHVKDGGF